MPLKHYLNMSIRLSFYLPSVRCSLLVLSCLYLTLQVIGAQKKDESSANSKPNFLIFIVDDLGYGDLGCFGNTTLRTPNIDSLAATGTKMTHVVAASAYCTPSRTAILTGRYPIRTGMAPWTYAVHLFLASRGGLPQGTVTFPKLLQQAGYTTGIVGKWHMGLSCNWKNDLCHHPNNQGFDHFYGVPLSNMVAFEDSDHINVIAYLNPKAYMIFNTVLIAGTVTSLILWILGYRIIAILLLLPSIMIPGFGYWVLNNVRLVNSVLMRNGEVVEQPMRLWTLTTRFVHESKNFIEKQHSDEKPFLLFLTFTQVHAPLAVHPSRKGRSRHGLYGDSVEEVDWAVGQLLNVLDDLNIRNDTVVMFLSDHGTLPNEHGPDGEPHGGSNGPFSGGKGMYGMEGALRVPLIFSWPGKIPQGATVDVPSSLMDLFPTILKLANVNYPDVNDLDGKDMMPLITKEIKTSRHQFLFNYGRLDHMHAIKYIENSTAVWKVHYILPDWVPGTRHCAYMCSHWPEMLVFLDTPLVYNVISDPQEMEPLDLNDPKRLEVLQIVQQALAVHKASVVPVSPQLSLINGIWLPWLQPCCNFPFCSCEENINDILK